MKDGGKTGEGETGDHDEEEGQQKRISDGAAFSGLNREQSINSHEARCYCHRCIQVTLNRMELYAESHPLTGESDSP
jgi:hypothetical protein